MKPFVFESSLVLPVALEDAWDFFSNPRNLARITPPDMKMRMTTAVETDMYAGQIISYSVRPLRGISVTWVTEITHVNKPFFFVDEQRFGPYRFWHHQHFFRQVEGGTEIRDLVHYLLSHMQFARLANRLVVAPRLKQIFEYRRKELHKLFP